MKIYNLFKINIDYRSVLEYNFGGIKNDQKSVFEKYYQIRDLMINEKILNKDKEICHG